MTAPRLVVAVPNISEGRHSRVINEIAGDDQALLDVHSDPDHNRSVVTFAGAVDEVARACTRMVDRAIELLDIRQHVGAHPRFGVVDVLPVVPYSADDADAARVVERVAAHADRARVPVHLYDRAAPGAPSLPELRRLLRTREHDAHPTAGVLCLGIRDPLVAFNVNLQTPIHVARMIARRARTLPGVRALAFELPSRGVMQISLNLTTPAVAGPRAAYDFVAAMADAEDAALIDAEVVGLLPGSLNDDLTNVPLRSEPRTIEEALAAR